MGCVIGAVLNFAIMIEIVQNQFDILRSIEGTNIWSGQNLQQFNSLAISFSSPKELYSVGGKYEWVTLGYLVGFLVPIPFFIGNKLYPHWLWSYFNTSIIVWNMGVLPDFVS
jgi:hypothetical protein